MVSQTICDKLKEKGGGGKKRTLDIVLQWKKVNNMLFALATLSKNKSSFWNKHSNC
jgi:DUF4097 and DUF4098 domain-containing protein YvlB